MEEQGEGQDPASELLHLISSFARHIRGPVRIVITAVCVSPVITAVCVSRVITAVCVSRVITGRVRVTGHHGRVRVTGHHWPCACVCHASSRPCVCHVAVGRSGFLVQRRVELTKRQPATQLRPTDLLLVLSISFKVSFT